jgi:hypothetical protein
VGAGGEQTPGRRRTEGEGTPQSKADIVDDHLAAVGHGEAGEPAADNETADPEMCASGQQRE